MSRMRVRPVLAVLLIAVSFTAYSPRALSQDEPPPLFTGEALPFPPMQDEPWEPPETDLPDELIEATRLLFAQGLPDPRGCEYRRIEVAVGVQGRGAGEAVTTAGWVLPRDPNSDRRFAICWNGLV